MKKIIFIISTFLVLTYGLIDVDAKEINVNGYYGVVKCTEVFHTSGQLPSDYVDCNYIDSYTINGDSTTYTMLDKAVSDFTGQYYNYSVVSRVFLFGYFDFKKDNYYTLNFTYNTGSFVTNHLDLTTSSDVSYSYFGPSDYVEGQGLKELSYSQTFDYSTFTGYISITFKATENTSSYRFIIDSLPLFRNTSFEYNQGVRVYLLNAIEEEDNTSALLGQITNQNNTMINQNQTIINNGNITNDFLTDDTPPESDISSLGNVQGLLPAGPVDSLLNIPFKFLSIIVSSLGDVCTPLSINWVFDKRLTLPCFSDSFYNNVPSGLMIFINLIPSGFILIVYFKYLYKKVNRAVSMETTAEDEWGVL